MQRKFIRSILIPIRVLNKAKNFYMKNIESCAGRLGDGSGFVGGPSAPVCLSKSFSTANSSMASDDEELRRLLRTVTSNNGCSDQIQRKPVARQYSSMGYGGGMGMRSYSVGLGKIGRIDEDKPCDFEEDEVSLPLYSRSRTYAVNRTSLHR